MKLLLVQLLDYRFPFGGAHKANRRLMEAFAARGHECQVFAPGYETVKPRADERERLLADLKAAAMPVVAEDGDFVVYRSLGVEVHAMVSEFSLAGYGLFHDHLAAQIRDLAPDWVLVSEDHTGLFLGAALELAPGRVVYIAHAQPTLPFGPEAFDQDPAKAALFGRVAGILTVSDYVRGYIRRWGGFEATVIGFPVYGEPPYPRFGDFDRGAVTLVNASGLKGLPIFLDLAAAFPGVPFTAVPSWGTGGEERAALAALPNVTLREPRQDIDEILAGARVLLAPSLWGEAFGVIAVEAMLRGIPVLASDLGGLPEAKLGVDYVLPVAPITEYRRLSPFEKPVPVLPPQDSAPWRQALARVLTGREHYERLAEDSRRAAQAFVAGLGAPAFEAYLQGLADRREAPGGPTLPHVLLSTHGTHGDVLPFLTLGEQLVRRGHRVTLVTHAVFAGLARAAGLEFIGLGSEESYRQLIEDTADLFNRPDDVFAASRAYLERQKVFDDDREELRLIDAACTGDTVLVGRYEDVATLLVAEKRGLPLAWVLLSPSHLATARVRAELFGDELLGGLQELRAAAGLAPVASYTAWLERADWSIALWPAWFSDPEPRDVEAVGFVLNEPLETEPLPSAVEALLAQRPLLVSSGTTKIIRPEFFTATLEAASRANLPVLVVTRHRELLPAHLPAACHWFSYLPFTRLLPRVRAVVHHGGIGTIAHALAAGVPQLILAEGVDRPDNARRLARRGAAESLKPADWTPERIGQALGRLSDPAFAARCLALATETRGSGAVAAACERIAELFGSRRAAAPLMVVPSGAPRPAAPAGTAREGRLSQLSPEKRALLALRLAKKKGAGQHGIPRLPRGAGGEDFFPLSFAQERFWFLEQLKDQREPRGDAVEAYTVAVASYHLAGGFRNDLLEQSLAELARRHEVFRTSFPEAGGIPRQRVLREGRIPLAVEDLGHLAPEARKAALRERILAEYRRGFDLAQGPLLRVLLLELAADERVLVFTLHHLIYDGWSVRIFLEELTGLYQAALAGAPAALPALPVQYADFAGWQRQWLAGERLDSLLAYWRGHLAGAAPVLDLPVDRSRPRRQSFRGAQRALVLEHDLAERLRQLARAEGVSLSMVLKAGFDILLHRYTQESDFVVGVPTAGREQPETEGLIGVFINLLAIRTRVAGEESLRQLLPAVRRAVLEGAEHQALPFEKLVAELAPARDLGRHPLFQVLFAFNQRSRESAQFQDAVTTWYETGIRHARVDLALEVSEEPDQSVTVALEFSTDLFDSSTVHRMARQLAVLLGSLAERPEGAIARLPLLTPEEREQLLPESAEPRVTLAQGGVHELFALQAARQPEAWAIVTPEERVTFGALNQLADQVGTHLLHASRGAGGVGPVALLLPNGIQHVAAMIGVLKAGGSFVCLDPEYPAARLRRIVLDLRPAVLLANAATGAAHGGLLESLAAELAIDVGLLESIASRPVPGLVPALAARPGGASAAVYVAYTSGSTGQPKGIVQTHGGFRHLIEWFAGHFQITPGKIVAQWIAVGHDPCYVEVWSALAAGATLSIAPPEIRRDPASLHRFLGEEAIAVIQMTPSLCRQILDLEIAGEARAARPGLPALEAVLLTGEALPVTLARDWLDRFGARPALHNVYGPTESILVTSQHVERVDPAAVSIPVGAPVAGCRIFVLDGNGEACPLGVPGELYVRSPFLASGYHGMPRATAAAFVQNPVHAAYPDRVYRTGDFGRFRADGALEFRGRADRQVKLRGQRLELGEVEAVLARHPAVEECAVELRTAADGDQSLVAYAVAPGDLTAGELRAWLVLELPPFMVPNALHLPAALPRTATGKVDYAALRDLPAPESRPEEREDPSDEVAESAEEELVAALFAEYLHRDRVGRREDFFALGGHSLLAALVANRLREHYLLDLRVRDIFTHPTVAGLAGFIAAERRGQEQSGFAGLLQQALEQVQNLSEEDAGRLLSNLAEPSA